MACIKSLKKITPCVRAILRRCFISCLLICSAACNTRDSTTDSFQNGLPITRFKAGQAAPQISLNDLSGNVRTLAEFKGRVVLINFWATWCAPCVAEMGALERLYQSFKDQGLVVLGVSGDSDAQFLAQFVKKSGITFPILHDARMLMAAEFGVTAFPESYFLDAQGKFLNVAEPESKGKVVRIVSDRRWDSEEFKKMVSELLIDNAHVANSSQTGFTSDL